MSGMTGYDQATSYPSPAQYGNYVPNLQGAGDGLGGDPRQLHGGHGWHHGHGYGAPHPGAQMQSSPTQQQRYPYYDRNGYYMHQGAEGSQQNWHEPVVPVSGGGLGPPVAGAVRPDSPSNVMPHGFPQVPQQPVPQQPGGGAPGSQQGQYSCKLATGPPSPSEVVQQKIEPNSQHPTPPGGNSMGQQQTPYQQYPCPISQSQQHSQGQNQQQVYNNNLPQVPQPPPNGAGVGGSGNGAPPYNLTPEHHGQPSPGSMGGGGPNSQNQNAPQAPLPSPLYPWMRSQFGKGFTAQSLR